MWNKEMIQQMFPNNILPSNPYQSADSLLYEQYDAVSIRENMMARGMVHQTKEITWLNDGSKREEIIYDVYPFPKVNATPCLSVYGGKMVQNWLQLESYRPIREKLIDHEKEKKEACANAGFSYTGL